MGRLSDRRHEVMVGAGIALFVVLFVGFALCAPCRFANATIASSTHGNSQSQGVAGVEALDDHTFEAPPNMGPRCVTDPDTGVSVSFSFGYRMPTAVSVSEGEQALHETGSCIACDEMREMTSPKRQYAFLRIETTPADLPTAAEVTAEEGEILDASDPPTATVCIRLNDDVNKYGIEVYECDGKQGTQKLESEIEGAYLEFTFDGKSPVAVSYNADAESLIAPDTTVVVPDEDDDDGSNTDDDDEDESDDESLWVRIVRAGCEVVSRSVSDAATNR